MKCPNCTQETKVFKVLAPRKHLEAGSALYHCNSCGTLWQARDFTQKILHLSVPKVARAAE